MGRIKGNVFDLKIFNLMFYYQKLFSLFCVTDLHLCPTVNILKFINPVTSYRRHYTNSLINQTETSVPLSRLTTSVQTILCRVCPT